MMNAMKNRVARVKRMKISNFKFQISDSRRRVASRYPITSE
jgi:hypothetical protein